MVNIPMVAKKPMRTPELTQINRTGRTQTLQTLRQPAAGRSAGSTPPPDVRQSPPPAGRSPSAPPPASSAPPTSTRQSAPPVPCRPHPPATGTALQKGQKISLSQLAPGLEQVDVGLGWDLAPSSHGYELDVEAFLLGPDGKVPGDDWFVFYNQPASPDGAVRLLEAGPPSAAPGDDQVIQVDLRRLSPNVARIAFILTINEARAHGYHFGGVSSAYVRIMDRSAHRELVRFQLTDYYSSVCSMVVGEIYRYKDEWRFNPVGNGTGDDLAGLCTRYGVDV